MMIFRPLHGHLVTATTVLLITTSAALDAPQEGIAVYSDLCFHSEAGDLLGTRVVLMRFKDGNYIFFQEAKGEFQEPQLGTADIDSKNDAILFRVPQSDGTVATFKGKITDKLLIGTFDNSWTNRKGEKAFRLPKWADRQRPYPECH